VRRYERFYALDIRQGDAREEGQRDRDRILYTSALRRLAGITQVVSPAEGHVFHNRLTHSLEVAQIGRRLAESLIRKHDKALVNAMGGVDPDVVEAAALAHDLGHPPFGHVAEEELNKLLDCPETNGNPKPSDGFEGNAQSFRIVTKLAVRYPRYRGGQHIRGLNLTRATLNAVLKYPRLRPTGDRVDNKQDGKRWQKWGVYDSEQDYLRWAREALASEDHNRSAEAELMDWADDVAYAVHDLEDFYRAGLIPLDRLVKDKEGERRQFLQDWAFPRLEKTRTKPMTTEYRDRLEERFNNLFDVLPIGEPYEGTHSQRFRLRHSTSGFINDYVNAVKLTWTATQDGKRVEVNEELRDEVEMLKELTWRYVIKNPSLATQQHGQRRVIRELFEMYMEAAHSGNWTMFPEGYAEEFKLTEENAQDKDQGKTRIVVDLIASMTEQQALKMHQKLTGISLGSVLDPTAL
jgi:dGTPase